MTSEQHKRLFLRILGVSALFSGVALLTHIVSGFSLRLALLLTGMILVGAVTLVWRRTAPAQRVLLIQHTKVGLLSGVLATVTYDVSKFALSQLDASPYNPFEVLHVFGTLLVGAAASEEVIYSAGTAFHGLNGICFGIAFCFLFRRHLVLLGIAWGLFLELFQLTLYPGWLDIRFYREFAQISALSHVVYGAVLGLSCQYGLREKTIGSQPS